MDSSAHPSLPVIDAKGWVLARKDYLRELHPEWSDTQVSTIAEWDYYFAQWKIRFIKNIPYAALASVGSLSLFKNVIWFEPTLASLLGKWSEVAFQIFKVASLGLFERFGVDVPMWVVNYLTVGVGMAGLSARTISDVQVIKKSSALGDPMEHLVLTSGCFGCGMWVVFAPVVAPLWPGIFMILLASVFSSSLARDWDVSRSQLAVIQIKRAGTFMEPFVIASVIWAGFAILA